MGNNWNGKGEFNQSGQDWLNKLGISGYLDNMEGYYQNIISKHSTTKEEIEQIFQMCSRLIPDISEQLQDW